MSRPPRPTAAPSSSCATGLSLGRSRRRASMRPAWRLGINSLSGRRSRSALLVCSVALSAALIATVACAMASMHAGLKQRVDATVGAADLHISRAGKDSMGPDILEKVRAWPETRVAVPRAQGPIILKNPKNGYELPTVGNGVDAALDAKVRATCGRVRAPADRAGRDRPGRAGDQGARSQGRRHDERLALGRSHLPHDRRRGAPARDRHGRGHAARSRTSRSSRWA